MLRYFLRQLLGTLPLLLAVSIAAFAMVRLLPGDAATAYLNSVNAPLTEEALAAVRAELGLDQPIPAQYVKWLSRALHGDLGYSYQTRQPVAKELASDFHYTCILALASLSWILILSAGLGILSAWKANRMTDHLIQGFTFLGSSMPKFWLGFLLVQLFSLHWGLFPVQGATTWKHVVLPSFTLACSYVATYTKLLRNSALELQSSPFVRYSRARGFSRWQAMRCHVIPNALIPALTTLGLHLGGIMSGSVIIENVFAWPGLGRMCIEAVAARNYPMLQGYILLLSIIFIIANLLIDMLCAALDPRIRLEASK